MAQNQNQPPVENPLLMASLVGGNPELVALLKRNLELQIQREELTLAGAMKAAEAEKQVTEQAKAAQRQGAETYAAIIKAEQWRQKNCRHLQAESGRSALGALTNWDGTINVSCGSCNMIDIGTQAEMRNKYGTLYPKQENIGGPLPLGSDYE